ncbi:MAG: hypothetical protein PHU71_00250 [Candidatus Gracilibacteria bacterium]|nr:hypothetical protein [Candidatus Gracilibacteria bacterium]
MPVKQKKQDQEAATQIYLKLAEVKDNIMVLKDGGVRAVLEVDSVNFDLKSEREQNTIIYSYQGFLNSLEFPIQILIKSRKLDIDGYLENMTEIAKNQKDPRLQAQTFEYNEYIGKLVELADIMEKRFYVIVSHDPMRTSKINPFAKFVSALNTADSIQNLKLREKEFESLKKGLNQRVNSVREGLIRCGLNVHRLNTYELITMLYQVHNPVTAFNQKISDLSSLNVEAPPIDQEEELEDNE